MLESLLRLHHDDLHAELFSEDFAQDLRLALPHQAVIHVNAGESITDRLMDERRRNGGVNTTRERAEDAVRWPNLRLNRRDRIFRESPWRPGRLRLRNPKHEVLQQPLPARGVHHLRMELDPPEIAGGVSERSERRGVGRSKRHKSWRRINDGVAVAHPDALCTGRTEPVKEWTLRGTNADVGGTILTPS